MTVWVFLFVMRIINIWCHIRCQTSRRQVKSLLHHTPTTPRPRLVPLTSYLNATCWKGLHCCSSNPSKRCPSFSLSPFWLVVDKRLIESLTLEVIKYDLKQTKKTTKKNHPKRVTRLSSFCHGHIWDIAVAERWTLKLQMRVSTIKGFAQRFVLFRRATF